MNCRHSAWGGEHTVQYTDGVSCPTLPLQTRDIFPKNHRPKQIEVMQVLEVKNMAEFSQDWIKIKFCFEICVLQFSWLAVTEGHSTATTENNKTDGRLGATVTKLRNTIRKLCVSSTHWSVVTKSRYIRSNKELQILPEESINAQLRSCESASDKLFLM